MKGDAMEEYLEVTDPYQLSFIIHKEQNIEESVSYVVRDGFTFASLPATPTIYKLMAEYNSGSTVNAIEFTRTIKRIRGMMIQKKNEMKGTYNGRHIKQ
jgi:hypothetical protein